MKRLIYFIFLLFSVHTVFSQNNQDSIIYVYQNNGDFNAYHFSEIDSITFSKIDIEGIEQSDIVTQEIWTANDVHRTSLAAIDSISFCAPPIIINNDVFPLTYEHIPYVVDANVEGFTMLYTTPATLRPRIGNVVVAEVDCTVFPDGIMARVIKITETEDGYLYECEKAYLEDIYDQIIFHGDFSVDDKSNYVQGNNVQRVKAEFNKELWNLDFYKKYKYSGTTAEFDINDKATATITLKKNIGKPLYAKIELNNDLRATISLDAESETNLSPKPIQIGNTIRAARIQFANPLLRFIWLQPLIGLYGYFEEQGSVDLSIGFSFNRSEKATFTYYDKEWNIGYNSSSGGNVDVAELSMDGSAEVGIMPQILFSINGTSNGIGLRNKNGIKQVANLRFDALGYLESGVYDAIKDSKTQTYTTETVSVFAQAGLFSQDSKSKEYSFAGKEKLELDYFLLPEFKETFLLRDYNKVQIGVDVTRPLLLPVEIGMVLYDENGNLLQTAYDGDIYDGSNHSFYYVFDNYIDRSCVAYPVIKYGNTEIRATQAIKIEECPANITYVECLDAVYDKDAEYPNRLDIEITAQLQNTTNVVEWGVYYMENDQIYEFPFDNVSNNAKINLTGKYYEEELIIDYNNFTIERDEDLGVYVKKCDSSTEQIITIYSELEKFRIFYNTKPSVTFSDAHITKTEEDGNYVDFHCTYTAYKITYAGVFWIDYCQWDVSGGDWRLDNPDYKWTPIENNTFEDEAISRYYGKNFSNHSEWINIYTRNSSHVLKSNCINWERWDGGLLNCYVSEEPQYSPAYKDDGMNFFTIFNSENGKPQKAAKKKKSTDAVTIPCRNGVLTMD